MIFALCIASYGDYIEGTRYKVLEGEITANVDNWQVLSGSVSGDGLPIEVEE